MNHAPFSFERLDHLVLRTPDPETLVTFYRQLGATIERDASDTIGLVQLRLGESLLDILDINGKLGGDHPDGSKGRNLDHFAVRIHPFNASDISEFCQAHQIPCEVMPMPLLGADGLGPAVYIEDPDGNRIELKGPPEA